MNTRPEVGYLNNLMRQLIGQGAFLSHGDNWLSRLQSIGPSTMGENLARNYMIRKEGERKWPISSIGAKTVGTAAPIALTALYGLASKNPGPFVKATSKGGGALTQLAKNLMRGTDWKSAAARSGILSGTAANIDERGMADYPTELSGLERNIQTVIGTGIGATIPIVGRPLKEGFKWLKSRVAQSGIKIEDDALGKIHKAITDEGGTVEDTINLLKEEAKYFNNAVPSPVASLTEGTEDLAKKVIGGGGQAAKKIQKGAETLQEGQRFRVDEAVKKLIGDKNYYKQDDELVAALRRNADELYTKAYTNPKAQVIKDEWITEFLQDPAIKEAYDVGRRVLRLENLAKRGEQGADYIPVTYKEFGETLDLRTADLIKVGLDKIIKQQMRAQDPTAAALRANRNQFVKRLDELGGKDYKIARDKYKGDIEVIDAADLGFKKLGTLNHEEIAKKFASYTDAEKEAFRIGASRSLEKNVMKSHTDSNYAGKIINSPEMKKKIQAMFPDSGPETLALFEAVLQREADNFVKMQSILRAQPNASTFQIRAEDLSLTEESMRNIVFRLVSNAQLSKKQQLKLADLLMGDPEDVGVAIETLENVAKKGLRMGVEKSKQARKEVARTPLAGTITGQVKDDPLPSEAAALLAEDPNTISVD